MNEHKTHRHAGALRGRTKRTFATLIAIILTLTLSATALADSGKNENASGGRSDQSTTTSDTKPGNRYGNDKNDAGLNVEKIEAAIAELTDETVKASLTELLNAYVDAFDARQAAIDAKETDELSNLADAVSAAKTALDTALEAAGISTDTLYGVPEEAQDGTGKGSTNSNRPTLDTDEIAAAIAALDDTDENKAALSELLAAYEAALAAQGAADASALSDEELQALADAVQAAEDALLAATKEAGVTGGVGRGQFVSGYAYGNTAMTMEQIAAQITAMDDSDENKAVLTQLMQAYQAALAAEEAGDAAGLSDEERAALSDATNAAENALQSALENAGIDTQVKTQQQDGNEYQTRVIADENDAASESAGGILASFFQWLDSLFH